MRSPLDIISIGNLLGLNDREARDAITSNCLKVI